MTTRSTILKADADNAGIALRTLDQVHSALATARKTKADVAMARLMLRHGRLTDEARQYVEREYPQDAS